MRTVRGVGQHAIAFKTTFQHFGVICLFLPAALEREGERKLGKKLLAGIRHILRDTGAVLRAPGADLFRQWDQFFIPRAQLLITTHLAQRCIALLEQSLQVTPGGENPASL